MELHNSIAMLCTSVMINPQCMHEGYGSQSVCVSVCYCIIC